MSTVAIETSGLTRHFETVTAVDGLSLAVPAGTVFGFLGPNGAGKTTTIRLLLGLLAPSQGDARVLGYNVRRQADEIRQRSGALLEDHGLYLRLSAADNLAFYARIWRLGEIERSQRIRELLSHFDLWDRRHEAVGGWSRGMRQKLAVARTLLHRPELVFMDEPTAGLDPVAASSLRDDLAALARREGATIFLTTHNLAEAEKLCQQVAVIRQGRLVAVGHPDELRARQGAAHLVVSGRGFGPAVLEALRRRPDVLAAEVQNGRLRVELDGDVDTAPLISLLVGQGVEVQEVRRGQASLEEVFLTLMQEDAEAS
ncbi:MAG: ABC transporter ATP-binding protein [Candidatus Promineifilaceae bacterium]|nr:ABC transporter ATP-binding protein [Candidatus Promineifilaceae bacterium]